VIRGQDLRNMPLHADSSLVLASQCMNQYHSSKDLEVRALSCSTISAQMCETNSNPAGVKLQHQPGVAAIKGQCEPTRGLFTNKVYQVQRKR